MDPVHSKDKNNHKPNTENICQRSRGRGKKWENEPEGSLQCLEEDGFGSVGIYLFNSTFLELLHYARHSGLLGIQMIQFLSLSLRRSHSNG